MHTHTLHLRTVLLHTDKNKSTCVPNGHLVVSAEMLVKGHQSDAPTESPVELDSMDDGTSESEQSTNSTVNSPSVGATEAISNK